MNQSNPIWNKFDLNNNLIKEYEYWMLLIKVEQNRLGSCVAILKRDAFPLSKVTPTEMEEYAHIAYEIETALELAFKPHLVHHMSLMYKDRQIHFHIIPRYTDELEFDGMIWKDDNHPDPLLQQSIILSQDKLDKIKDKIKFSFT